VPVFRRHGKLHSDPKTICRRGWNKKPRLARRAAFSRVFWAVPRTTDKAETTETTITLRGIFLWWRIYRITTIFPYTNSRPHSSHIGWTEVSQSVKSIAWRSHLSRYESHCYCQLRGLALKSPFRISPSPFPGTPKSFPTVPLRNR
jgi:hypothetical protein